VVIDGDGHTRHWLLVLINLPFALVGGVLAVFASGGGPPWAPWWLCDPLRITLRNSIMLISHYEHLWRVRGAMGLDAAIRGASDRPRPHPHDCPSDATLGLLPLAMGSGAPGREIEGPMALVILGSDDLDGA